MFVPAQDPAPPPGQSPSTLHGPFRFVPALQLLLQTGQTWMPGAAGKRSPSRYRTEVSGRLRCDAPVLQFAVPLALVATTFTTHTLVGVLPAFGMGSGGPKRQPTLVQFRLLPVFAEVRFERVRSPVATVHEVTPVSEVP